MVYPGDLDPWLMQGDPWVRFQVLRAGNVVDRDMLDKARSELLAYPPFNALVQKVRMPWPPLVSHKSAGHPLHALSFLALSGLSASDLMIEERLSALLSDFGKDDIPRVAMRIGKAHGGSETEILAWALCDAPIVLRALVDFGSGDRKEVRNASERLRGMVRENGWPCVTSPDLGGFRGPGRKTDPCPFATLVMLRLLGGSPSTIGCEEAVSGAESLLDLWRRSRELHPYLFHMGTDFRKVKFPTIWYDILSVLDTISCFERFRDDERTREMAMMVREKADAQGRYTPEAIWMDWRDWDFGQKKVPSRGLTSVVRKVLDRL
jgi:hypothetical protein